MPSPPDRSNTPIDHFAARVIAQLAGVLTVERELKPGGQARVFVAHDTALDRRVVVKIFGGDGLSTASARRFVQEINLIATLQHPNIVPILSSGEIDGHPYFVMPYIAGDSLRTHMRVAGPLPVREATRILRDVARALAFAHGRGVVHRDVKPDNVLLTDGVAVVADFGIARAAPVTRSATSGNAQPLTMTGEGVGTPAYMAPEQIAMDPTMDHRADIYAFGILGYEMLAGGPMFGVRTPQSVVAAHLTERPADISMKRPDVPVALAQLIARCLEKDRDARPASALQLLDELDDSLDSSERLRRLPPATQASRGRRLLFPAITAALAVTALATIAGLRLHRARGRSESKATESALHTVLVLPFEAIGADSTVQILAEGISSELIVALTRVSDLRVAEQPGDLEVRRRFGTGPALATAMHAATLIEGSIQRSGAQLRISARVIDAATGVVRWADTFDHPASDVFGAQDDLLRAVSGAIQRQIPSALPAPRLAATSRGTANAEAYDCYLRARFFFQRRGRDALLSARQLLDRAISMDPQFARAFALRAQVASVLPIYSATSADASDSAGIADASRAIDLDSTLADAWTARASLLTARFDWNGAEADFRRALMLSPQDPLVHEWFGEELLVRGRVRDAESELTRAVELDPLSPILRASLAVATAIAGNRKSAIELARHAVELDSTLFATQLMLGSVLAYDGRFVEALRFLDAANRADPGAPVVLGMLGYVDALSGSTERARAVLDRLHSIASADADFAAAHIFVALHDNDRALSALGRAADRRAPQFAVESLFGPVFDPLRHEARFQMVIKQLGL